MLPPACNSLRDWFAEHAERVGHGEVHGFTKTAWPCRKLALGWHSVGHFGSRIRNHAWLSHLVGPYSSPKGLLVWDWHCKQFHCKLWCV